MQGRIWNQNLHIETKCLHKTLVVNMQIFLDLNEILSKHPKKITTKPIFQNRIII
jgi:hypothetical protein